MMILRQKNYATLEKIRRKIGNGIVTTMLAAAPLIPVRQFQPTPVSGNNMTMSQPVTRNSATGNTTAPTHKDIPVKKQSSIPGGMGIDPYHPYRPHKGMNGNNSKPANVSTSAYLKKRRVRRQ